MEILIGLLIIAIGSFCQSSSYVPIKKVKEWSWESFWLIQGVFAWLVFPFLGSLLGVPQGSSLLDLWGAGGAGMSIFYGILWGVGGLTFGLSMRYLGVALGQSISLGTCAGFGTLLPALFAGTNLFAGNGLILLLGVCITLAGIAIIGYAGSLRAQNMSEEEKRAAVKDFALTKGLLVALLAGVMSACFALGLDAGTPIKEAALAGGVEGLYAGLPVICSDIPENQVAREFSGIFWVKSENVGDIKKQIQTICDLASPVSESEYQENKAIIQRKYSLDAWKKRIVELYLAKEKT